MGTLAQRRTDAEPVEHFHRVGADIDRGANAAKPRRLLVDLDRVPSAPERDRGCQAADASPDDGDGALGHGAPRSDWFDAADCFTAAPACGNSRGGCAPR